LWREWLVPDGAYRRYKGLRGILWYWLSRDVRKDEWERYGVCITCLEPVEDWHYADCGHMVDAANCGEYLRFLRRNLALQHKKCNNPRFTPSAMALNAVHYDQRYGQGAWEKLYALKKKECKEPTQGEYKDLIRALPSFQEALKLSTPSPSSQDIDPQNGV
jgi:hypothetical protein